MIFFAIKQQTRSKLLDIPMWAVDDVMTLQFYFWMTAKLEDQAHKAAVVLVNAVAQMSVASIVQPEQDRMKIYEKKVADTMYSFLSLQCFLRYSVKENWTRFQK